MSNPGKSQRSKTSKPDPFRPYEIISRGRNSQGNKYDNRIQQSGPGYHYSNRDGSYKYKNGDNSEYLDNGRGMARYKTSSGAVYEKSVPIASARGLNGGYGGTRDYDDRPSQERGGSGEFREEVDQRQYRNEVSYQPEFEQNNQLQHDHGYQPSAYHGRDYDYGGGETAGPSRQTGSRSDAVESRDLGYGGSKSVSGYYGGSSRYESYGGRDGERDETGGQDEGPQEDVYEDEGGQYDEGGYEDDRGFDDHDDGAYDCEYENDY